MVLVEWVEEGAAQQGGEYRSGDRGDLVSQEVLVRSLGTRAEGRPQNVALPPNETYITRRCVSKTPAIFILGHRLHVQKTSNKTYIWYQ